MGWKVMKAIVFQQPLFFKLNEQRFLRAFGQHHRVSFLIFPKFRLQLQRCVSRFYFTRVCGDKRMYLHDGQLSIIFHSTILALQMSEHTRTHIHTVPGANARVENNNFYGNSIVTYVLKTSYGSYIGSQYASNIVSHVNPYHSYHPV